MIEINIQKNIRTYEGSKLLRVADHIPVGSITKMYGPSGIGKTTFLRIVAGLSKAEQGKIEVHGKTWLNTDRGINLSPQERNTGFVFQDYALFPHMTVNEHLQYATSDEALIRRLLLLGRMERFQSHRPQHLSGGQQQRLAILRSLAIRPQLLLMDEAFSALDDELREDLITDLKVILKEFNTTTIIVSHHAQETLNFADRSLKID